MQFQRIYRQPNCTLVVEGLADPAASLIDTNTLSIVTHSECQILGLDPVISGGRDFLVDLIKVVGAYSQGVISGIPRPAMQVRSPHLDLHPGEGDRHQLVCQPETTPLTQSGSSSSESGQPLRWDLSTVQLFDLMEAIDQLLADPQTLPDLQFAWTPVHRRQVPAQEPLVQRAIAPTLGATILAIAAAGFIAMPVPQVKPPRIEDRPTTTTTPAGTSLNLITDAEVVQRLQSQTQQKLAQTWKSRPSFDTAQVYRVTIDEQGQIIGYRREEPLGGQNYEAELPLKMLLQPNAARAAKQALDLRVVFLPQGTTEVKLWTP
jgi:hypothetical protein